MNIFIRYGAVLRREKILHLKTEKNRSKNQKKSKKNLNFSFFASNLNVTEQKSTYESFRGELMYILEQYSIAAAYPSDMPVLSFCPCKSSADTLFELGPVAIRVKNACFTVKNNLPSPGKIFFEPCRMFADFFRFTVNASDTGCYTYKEKAGSSCQVISVGSFCQKIHETAVKTRERVRHFRSFDKNISRVMRL